MRHGHAAKGDDDFARPLTDAGVSAVRHAAQELKSSSPAIDLILHSAALRATRTAELVAEACETTPTLRSLSDLYLAEPQTYIDAIGSVSNECRGVLVVGHNPGLSQLCYDLWGYSRGLREADYVARTLTVSSWAGALLGA